MKYLVDKSKSFYKQICDLYIGIVPYSLLMDEEEIGYDDEPTTFKR